ncbi:uncharacterized protein LOC133846344 [Drosophila sulfurigaster albostrigata]|uniref:Uncharacterized protein LOC127565604 n=1 Tax=Drosophila albomicans TaxID=7291 RepID=A0A9C6T6A9_DROAB|nr:uncharacterized protein LOC127565604 [Drosophila albomicans]XP_060660808.1 uncharacterized protein LOC132794398 [Drosophila nasuta]XP_062137264.1 uncharacterized protein LOC133846344 [Drosophila sulfurigaster albostrigata]
MFKELVVFVHTAVRNFFLMRPTAVGPRGSACRVVVKNSWWANIVFFIAIFTPLYVCLLKDVLGLLRDVNYKINRGN